MTMPAFVPRVTHVEVLGPYRLALAFVDGSEQKVDLEPLLHGQWFGTLRDRSVFNGVAIDPHGSLVWPNGVTVSLWTLHDWPNAGPRFVADVQKNTRGMRRARIMQRWFAALLALWNLWNVVQWAGWFGAGPISPRDMLMPAALLGMSTGSWLLERSLGWSVVLLLLSVGLLLKGVSLR